MPRTGRPENLKPFKPGQSGNPGGMSSETRRLIAENAKKATEIRAALLASIQSQIEAGITPELGSDLLRLVKDTEDRGFGAPKQTTEFEGELGISGITRRIIDHKPEK